MVVGHPSHGSPSFQHERLLRLERVIRDDFVRATRACFLFLSRLLLGDDEIEPPFDPILRMLCYARATSIASGTMRSSGAVRVHLEF